MTSHSKRKELDFYPTGEKLVSILLNSIKLEGKIFECCCGEGHISQHLENPIVNDIIHGGFDMKLAENWPKEIDWTVTNPPYNLAFEILLNAIRFSRLGVAFLLRLSFLEPTYEREDFLNKFPPNKIIVLPRFSYTQDGKTDSVTSAWMIWDKSGENFIKISRKDFTI